MEFVCNDGSGLVAVNIKLLNLLEKLRAELGNKIITISSGYRTPKHNAAVGGEPGSQHLHGNAADIVVDEVTPKDVVAAAEAVGFDGIGNYATFTHVDVRGQYARW